MKKKEKKKAIGFGWLGVKKTIKIRIGWYNWLHLTMVAKSYITQVVDIFQCVHNIKNSIPSFSIVIIKLSQQHENKNYD